MQSVPPSASHDPDRTLVGEPSDFPEGTGGNGLAHPGGRPRRRIDRPLRLALVLLVALIIAGVTFLLTNRSGSPTHAAQRPPSSPAAPPRQPFLLPDPTITVSLLGPAKSWSAATPLAGQIQTDLSTFYDRVFVDPHTWSTGVPSDAWSLFAPDVQSRAEADAASLTIGSEAIHDVTALTVTHATLAIRVLLDGAGRPRLASADVTFDATGTVTGGAPLTITNRATFVFRAFSGQWLVVAYPVANTTVDAGAPSPSPSASSSPGASP